MHLFFQSLYFLWDVFYRAVVGAIFPCHWYGVVIALVDRAQDIFYAADDGLRGNVMLFVIGALDFASSFGFVYCGLHRAGDLVGVEYYSSFDISRGPSKGLDKGAFAS